MVLNEKIIPWFLCMGVAAIMGIARYAKKMAMGFLCAVVFFTSVFSISAWYYCPSWEQRFMYHFHQVWRFEEHYRHLSYALLHLNGFHLISNMAYFLFFGYSLVARCQASARQLCLIYVGGIWFSAFYGTINNGVIVRAIGASGGVSAIVGSYLAMATMKGFKPRGGGRTILFPILLTLFFMEAYIGIFNNIWDRIQRLPQKDDIGHAIHLDGLVYGTLFSLIWFAFDRDNRVHRWAKKSNSKREE